MAAHSLCLTQSRFIQSGRNRFCWWICHPCHEVSSSASLEFILIKCWSLVVLASKDENFINMSLSCLSDCRPSSLPHTQPFYYISSVDGHPFSLPHTQPFYLYWQPHNFSLLPKPLKCQHNLLSKKIPNAYQTGNIKKLTEGCINIYEISWIEVYS